MPAYSAWLNETCFISTCNLQFAPHFTGSNASAGLNQRLLRGDHHPTIAIFDGDQRVHEKNNFEHAKNMCEKAPADFQGWFKSHIGYLPGTTWPEAWLVQKGLEGLSALSVAVSAEEDPLAEAIEYGLQAGKHNEFYEIAKNLGLSRQLCLQSFAAVVCSSFASEFSEVSTAIADALTAAG